MTVITSAFVDRRRPVASWARVWLALAFTALAKVMTTQHVYSFCPEVTDRLQKMKITTLPRRLTCTLWFAWAIICPAPFASGQNASAAALNQAGITQALHQRMVTANTTWQKREGAGLQCSLSIAKGKPTLFFEIDSGEQIEDIARRRLAIVTALDFILADDGFDRVRVSITESTPRKRYERSIREVEIARSQFQAVATAIAKTQTARDAVKVARRDRTVLDQVCVQLGVR